MTAADLTIADHKAKVDLVDIVGRHVKLQRRGSEQWGCCPFHADRRPSFKVDPDQQRFHCFGCGAGGDIVDFVARIEHLDFKAAIARVAELAGPTPTARERRPSVMVAAPDRRAEANRDLAQEIWRQTEAITRGLPFEYLVQRRGIHHWDCDRVRWHSACPWGRDRVGCIVAPVVSHVTGYTIAIWRIRPVMEGPVERRGLGPAKHNCSPTWWPEGDELAIAEGVEDALAVRQLTGLPCWAALSAGNMAELRGIPAWIRSVSVFTDLDDVGRQGAHLLARRLREEGRRVRVIRALAGKDPNGQLIAGRPAA